MDLQTHGYIVGIAGLFYGSVGYGLSIFTCIFGPALRRLFPDFAQLPARKSPIPGLKILKRRRNRSSSKRTTPHRVFNLNGSGPTANIRIANTDSRSLRPPPDTDRLRRVSSLDSFERQKSLVLVTPVIRVDDIDTNAPAATLLPNSNHQSDNKISSKRRSLTIAHPPSLPDLPRRPSGEEAPCASTFRISSLKPFWGGEKAKHEIHRSASSPQLNLEKLLLSDSKKESSQDKVQSILSRKSSKKTLRQEKTPENPTSQSSHSKFFCSLPKTIEKKRSQVLRTQPYEAPYFVPPPTPPPSLNDLRRGKDTKRGNTLPPEKVVRPSTAPQHHPTQ